MLDLLGPGYYVWKRTPFGRRKCKAHLASHFELLSYFNKIPLIIAKLVFVQKTFSMDLISERDIVGVKGKGLMFDRIYVSNILGFTFGSNVAYEKFRYIHGLPRDKLSKTNWGEHLEVVISSLRYLNLSYIGAWSYIRGWGEFIIGGNFTSEIWGAYLVYFWLDSSYFRVGRAIIGILQYINIQSLFANRYIQFCIILMSNLHEKEGTKHHRITYRKIRIIGPWN